MKKLYIFFASIGLLSACVERQPPIVSDSELSESLTMDNLLTDTTTVLDVENVDLIDSSRQILAYEIYHRSSKEKENTSRYIKGGSDYANDYIVNIVFEDLINQKKYLLTESKIRIIFHHQLLPDIKGKQYILYRMIDRDYNNDGKLNSNDIVSLYISNLDGTSFTKLTKDKENLVYEKWIAPLKRYYIQTLEDSNKDGYFDIKDKKHHYYIEFNDDSYKVLEYDPLEILQKK